MHQSLWEPSQMFNLQRVWARPRLANGWHRYQRARTADFYGLAIELIV